VAVNPDRELRKVAVKRGWQIRDFRKPVRMRQRLPVSRPTPSVTAMAAAAVVAAVFGWVYIRPRLARLAARRAA
jgi:hypothetical protein